MNDWKMVFLKLLNQSVLLEKGEKELWPKPSIKWGFTAFSTSLSLDCDEA